MAQGKGKNYEKAQIKAHNVRKQSVPPDLTTEERINLIRLELKQKQDSVDQLNSMLESLTGEMWTAEQMVKKEQEKAIRDEITKLGEDKQKLLISRSQYDSSIALINTRIFNLERELRNSSADQDITAQCKTICRKSHNSQGVYSVIVWNSPAGDKDVVVFGMSTDVKAGFRMVKPIGSTISYRIFKNGTQERHPC